MDIQAAQGGKAKALGVLTGVYSRQDLEGCGAGMSAGWIAAFHDHDLDSPSEASTKPVRMYIGCQSKGQVEVLVKYAALFMHALYLTSYCYTAESITLENLQDVPAVLKALNL